METRAPLTRGAGGAGRRGRGLRLTSLALAVAIAALAGTGAASGAPGGCSRAEFGQRILERGDCGSDVRTLNWVLKSKGYGVKLRNTFNKRTERSIRTFQRKRKIGVDGVVGPQTAGKLVRSMRRHKASWYGPGFWGNRTACGQRLRKRTMGVAHRSLPCGTRVVIAHGGQFVRTRVIDRGPYVKRHYERDWDLTRAAARKVGFAGVDTIRAAPIR